MNLAIIQARMGSTRLPGKVLKTLDDKPALQWAIRAAMGANLVDKVIVATSTEPADDEIANWCLNFGISCYRGSETDVLDRFFWAANQYQGDILLRLTGDCPLLDSKIIDEVIQLRKITDADYATNTNPPSYPDGLDVEVFTMRALRIAHQEATRATDRDCVTRYIVRNSHRFRLSNLTCPLPDLVRERWVLDSPEDLEFIRRIVRLLPVSRRSPCYLDILGILDREPDLRKINAKYSRNERFYDALTDDILQGPRSYEKSQEWLQAAEKTIPLGTQTYSKSRLMFPAGAAPLFLSHGDAGYVFDVDGNDYVDLVGGLLPVILGYRDGDVDAAIRAQLDRGISFSLATPLELILSKTLNRLIPSAEMVRFGKNGSDVTSAAVRLARHITKRDRIYACGYHGWHDWSIGANPEKNNGVPHSVQELTSRYYDRERFVGDEVAAVVLEPEFYTKEDLVKWREAADELGFLLVFDEIISGFRFGLGGLQKVHGVIPDLSTFGKSMANGMPISALVGKEKYMKKMTEISYSGTFFGETLSIAAAIATIAKLERENVPQYLDDIGLQIWFEINRLRAKHGITEEVHIHGHAALPRIRFGDRHIQSLFIAEMAKRGVLVIGSLNLMYAHKPPQLQHILRAFDGTLEAIKTGVELSGKPIEGKAVR